MQKNVLILTEAGDNIGFGHYTRCSAIRMEMENQGANTDMIVNLKGGVISDSKIVKLDWLSNLKLVNSLSKYSIVIVDSYLAKASVYKTLKSTIEFVVAIDDYNRISYPVDLLINPNVYFQDLNYSNQKSRCHGGKDFIILRPEFRTNQNFTKAREEINEILITLGGSDYRNLLPKVIEFCLQSEIQSIKVVAPHAINGSFDSDRLTILPVQTAKSMKKLILNSDVVISACGQTLHELAALGRPTIGICIDDDQRLNQNYYLNTGFLNLDIQWDNDDLQDKILTSISMLNSSRKRELLIKHSSHLVNKNGVVTLVKTIIS